MVSSMLWVGSSVLKMSETIARIDARLEYASLRLQQLEGSAVNAADDRYRGRDARRDWDAQSARDKAQDERITLLERTLKNAR
jgi:hypothetical protein